MKNLSGKNVLVLGLGQSGLALARWCIRSGASVTVADTRPAPPQLQTLNSTLPQVVFVNAPLDEALFNSAEFDLVLTSPGLSPPSIAGVTAAAATRGTAVGNELSVFSQVLKELQTDHAYVPQVIGVTGTNGKTTVTALTAQLVARAGKSVAMAGNIGPTLLDTLGELIGAQKLPDVWVLELSSFQLDGVHNFEPTVATVLNISQDHLDWHETNAAYAAAKANVYGSNTCMLLNRDDMQVMASKPIDSKGKLTRKYITFGVDEPRRAGDYGIQTLNGIAWLVRAAELDESIKLKRGSKGDEIELFIQRLMPVDALRIAGLHNAANALAALALANAVGCTMAPMLHGLREYRGEPHRVQSVAVVDGIEYFDDSKGTNVGATVAALSGLGANRKLVVILGGEGKGQDFSPLLEPVLRYARAVVLIGRDAPLIRTALNDATAVLVDASSMDEAVVLATSYAKPGDAVLMSPACASFDMFDNYEHRAHAFCDAVAALAVDRGVTL
jgi:UDP-N-acetylmuramoylalanine--D-glutamate ligase